VRDKVKLTETLVAELPEEFRESVDNALKTWWANIRKSGGLRLTDHGFYVFTRVLDLASYKVEMKQSADKMRRLILTLDKKLQTPYYIEITKRMPVCLHMFGSREAVTAHLYGDLEKFLNNYN